MIIRTVGFIVPCYNEAENIAEAHRRLSLVAENLRDYEFEFLFVDDGSSDATGEILDILAGNDPRVKVLHLAHRQGHQAAATAGIDYADTDLTVIIDADLQDPPELAGEMIAKAEAGFDVVHAQRGCRHGESWFKLLTAKCFYRLMAYFTEAELVQDSGDFRAITRPVLNVIQGFREPHRFLRGLFPLLGFRQCVIRYDRDSRHAGKTKYPLIRMIRLALDAILGFSAAPVRFVTLLSLFFWGGSLTYTAVALYQHFVLGITIKGWTSLVLLLSFYTGLTLLCITILGVYVSRIFEQGQRRPLYWLRDARNIDVRSVADRPDSPVECRLSRLVVGAQANEKETSSSI